MSYETTPASLRPMHKVWLPFWLVPVLVACDPNTPEVLGRADGSQDGSDGGSGDASSGTPFDVKRWLIWQSACDPSGWSTIQRLSAAVASSQGLVAPTLLASIQSCQADNCMEFLSCAGTVLAGDCSSGEPSSCSDETHLRVCLAGRAQVRDCRSPFNGVGNGRCFARGDGTAICGHATCDSSTPEHRCEGDVGYSCRTGVEQAFDCPSSGMHCVHGTDGSRSALTCVDRIESCTVDRCEGTTMLDCNSGLGTVVTNCADYGSNVTCVLEGGEARCDRVAGRECEEGDSHCEGSEIRYCYQGAWTIFDCADAGATCQANPPQAGTMSGPSFRCVIRS